MSRQDIFKKAVAAKLAGDEEGFKSVIPEANSAEIPAGYYTASFKARADGLADHTTIEALKIYPAGDDSVVASFTGEEANKVGSQYLPPSALIVSFFSLTKTNNGKFKSEAQAKYITHSHLYQ